MYSNFDKLVEKLGAYVDARDAKLAERGSFSKAYSSYLSSQKSFNATRLKAMKTLEKLQKSATAMHEEQKPNLIEQVPEIMAKARTAFNEGKITGHELCVIEAKKNRLCTAMAAKGLIR